MTADSRELLNVPHLVKGEVAVDDVINAWATRLCAFPKEWISAAYAALNTGYDPSENRRAADVRITILEALVARRDGGYQHGRYEDVFVAYPGDTDYDRTCAALRTGLALVAFADRDHEGLVSVGPDRPIRLSHEQ